MEIVWVSRSAPSAVLWFNVTWHRPNAANIPHRRRHHHHPHHRRHHHHHRHNHHHHYYLLNSLKPSTSGVKGQQIWRHQPVVIHFQVMEQCRWRLKNFVAVFLISNSIFQIQQQYNNNTTTIQQQHNNNNNNTTTTATQQQRRRRRQQQLVAFVPPQKSSTGFGSRFYKKIDN